MEGEEQKLVRQEKSSMSRSMNRFNTSMIKFKPSFTQRIKQKYLSSDMKQFINKQKWQRSEQNDHALIAIFAYIQEASCKSVFLHPSQDQYTFLKSIASISFPQLIHLNLKDNNLTSIQPLDSLNCPQLQYLNLSHNYIICIKPLNKIKFPNLQELFIHHNHFSHIQLGKVCLLSENQIFLSLFLSGSLEGNLIKQKHGNLTFLYDIRSLYMKLQTPTQNGPIFGQTFDFQVYAPVFTQIFLVINVPNLSFSQGRKQQKSFVLMILKSNNFFKNLNSKQKDCPTESQQNTSLELVSSDSSSTFSKQQIQNEKMKNRSRYPQNFDYGKEKSQFRPLKINQKHFKLNT